MALIREVQNSAAGTAFVAGKSPEIDAAIAEGNPGVDGVTVNAAGNYEYDGTEIVSAGGVSKVVDLSEATAEEMQAVANLAEAHFLAQTTGVSSKVINDAMEAVGIDPNDNTQSPLVAKLLDDAGYNSGDPSKTFDNNIYTGTDPAIAILTERLKQQPTDQDLIDAGLDPDYHTVVNSNAANAFYLEKELESKGLDYSGTNATRGSTAGYLSSSFDNPNSTIQQVRDSSDSLLTEAQGAGNFRTSDQELDMLEWDLIKKEKDKIPDPSNQNSNNVGYISGGAYNNTGQGQITGGASGSSYTGPNFVSTPNLQTVKPNISSGTYETDLPDYSNCLNSQMNQFTTRAADQAKLYQPQTQSEMAQKELADPDYKAPAFENVQYRNRFGMSMYIQHINGQPTQPIPPGYTKVATVAANQGGMIKGFDEGGVAGHAHPHDDLNTSPVNSPINYKPGGTVEPVDGGFKINYGGEDGFSQLYGSMEEANTANTQGLTTLGLPDYSTYLTNQGVDQSYGGYDEEAYKSAYQSYISDPGTVEQVKADAAAKAATAAAAAQTGEVGGDQVQTQTKVTVEDLEQANRNLAAQATIAPGGAVAAAPVSYLDTNQYGTVTEATAGQALGTAPMVKSDQVAQIDTATQARGSDGFNPQAMLEASGTQDAANPFIWDATKNKYIAYGDGELAGTAIMELTPEEFASSFQLNLGDYSKPPTATQVTANQAASTIKEAVSGKQKVDTDGTPLFNADGNPIMETDGMSAAQSTGPTKDITAAQKLRQKVDPTTGEPMFTSDAEGNLVPVMETASSVSGLDAAQGTSTDVTGEPTRKEETGEMIAAGNQNLSSVDQTKVDATFGTGEVAAASVKDELATLMSEFDGGETPAWAAGSMRKAVATMSARGLGASSMAGQAIIQAAMEAALPIAQIDTANKQQVALFKAEQRANFLKLDFDQDFQAKVANAAKVSEIANLNFTAQQQVALENSKNANSMNIANLSAKNAVVLSEAAALAQMDMANLNNLQTAAVQNAQNFLQIDMANLSNSQQTALFKQQSIVNSILSDQSAANAAQQFNATSQNQTDQFFANLAASVSQFNAAQQNAMKQYNAGEVNSLLEFNAGIQNQREMFNAQNYLVVAQANAQWRQNLSTINTSAANVSNMEYAQTVNALTLKNLDEIWQRERDAMDYSFTNSENNSDRALSLLLGEQDLDVVRQKMKSDEKTALGSLLTKVFFSWGTGKQ